MKYSVISLVHRVFYLDSLPVEVYGSILYILSGCWIFVFQPIPQLNPVAFPLLSQVHDNVFAVTQIGYGILSLAFLYSGKLPLRRLAAMGGFTLSLALTLILISAEIRGVAIPAFGMHALASAWAYLRTKN